MAKKATYNGPWDRHEFAAGEVHEDAQVYDRGVPVKVSNELAARLEEGPENFLIEDYNEAEDGKAAFNEPLFQNEEDADPNQDQLPLTDDTGGGETLQTGEEVSTPTIKSGRKSSRASS